MNSKLIDALRLVLEFVERTNKQDADREVAQAAQDIEMWLAVYSPDN